MGTRSDLLPSRVTMPRELLSCEDFLERRQDDMAAKCVDGQVTLVSHDPLSSSGTSGSSSRSSG